MRIGVFGAGHVGLVTGACLAELGNSVIVYDPDPAKISCLREGRLPFYEPGLAELIARNRDRFSVTPEGPVAVRDREIVFIAVGTAVDSNGSADTLSVRTAAETIAGVVAGGTVIVNKSTVPVHTGDSVDVAIRLKAPHARISVVSNPEFLREGSAVDDFLHPDRIVLGCDDAGAEQMMRNLYAPIDAPIVVTDRRSAEFIKYVANAFLATRVSFSNEIAQICDRLDANIDAVLQGAGLDKRIGTGYLRPGPGFGGSCLPKDLRALISTARTVGVEPALLSAVQSVNESRIEQILGALDSTVDGLASRRIAVLGLTFKPGTDDVRESPSLSIVRAMVERCAQVCAHDPVVRPSVVQAMRALGVEVFDDVAECLHGTSAFVLATAWPQYGELDPAAVGASMRERVAFDLHGMLDVKAYKAAEFRMVRVASSGRLDWSAKQVV
jgi:UDPglucose 6-dehydrogenase